MEEYEKQDEGMQIFVCWICKEFSHFSSKCPNRVKKTRNLYKSRMPKVYPLIMINFMQY